MSSEAPTNPKGRAPLPPPAEMPAWVAPFMEGQTQFRLDLLDALKDLKKELHGFREEVGTLLKRQAKMAEELDLTNRRMGELEAHYQLLESRLATVEDSYLHFDTLLPPNLPELG